MSGHQDELERELAAWLREEAPAGAPVELRRTVMSAAARTHQRGRWPRPAFGDGLRQALALAASVFAVVVVGVVIVALLSSGSIGPAGQSPTPMATAVGSAATGASPAPTAVPTHYPVEATFPGVTTFPVIAAGSIWAPQWDTGSVLRIDLVTNEVLATIRVGERPHAMAVRGSEIWVSGRDASGWAVMRIDPRTNQVAERIEVGDQGWAMAIADDTMWLTSFESNRVKRIDLAAREVVAEITLANPLGIAATADEVWVALGGQGTLVRIDPADNSYIAIRTATGTTTVPLIVENEVWLTTLSGRQVVIVSRDTNEVVDRIDLRWPMGLARQGELIWVTDDSADEGSADARVVAIDVSTRELVRVLPMPGTGVDRAISIDGDTIWMVGNGLMRMDISQPDGS